MRKYTSSVSSNPSLARKSLGLILAIGENFADFEKKGQGELIINQHIKNNLKIFDKVFVFSHQKEKKKLPAGSYLIPNKFKLHRFLYAVLLPIIEREKFKRCYLFRCLQITGGIPAVIAKVLWGRKFVVNYGFDYAKMAKIEGKKIQAILLPFLEKIVLRLADGVIITNKAFEFKVKPYNENVVLIPNGVDSRLYKPKLKVKSEKLKVKKILFVGRLEKQKNLFNLLKAIKILQEKKYKLELQIVGEGSLREKLEEFAKKEKIQAKFLGRVSYENLPRIYQQTDIFVLPSLLEGNPKALLEAMACGLSVIGTKVEGIKELIKDRQTGLLCHPFPEAIAKSITFLLSNHSLAEKMGKRARKFIEKNFDSQKLLKKEREFLKSLI